MRKNKFITSFIIAGALVGAIGVTSYAEAGKIKGSSIRLRKEANTNSTIIDTYGNGEEVDIIEKVGEWYKVKINGNTGYVYQDYIEVTEEKKPATETKPNKEENTPATNTEKKEEENKKEENKKEENKNEDTKTEEKKDQSKEETNKQSSVKLGKTKASSTQKVYILPNIGSSKIGEVKKNADVNIIQEVNGWAYVSTDNLTGWTRYDKIVAAEAKNNDKVTTYEQKDENKDDKKQEEVKEDDKKEDNKNTENNSSNEKNTEKNEDKKTENNNKVTEKKAYINVTSVNFRQEGSTSSEVIDVLTLNTEITIIGEDGDWYKVKYGNNEGYVAKQYVSDSKAKETTSRSGVGREVKEVSSTNEVTGEDIVAYAKNYLGYPYVYAAESPSVGFDCSGLVWYVYKHFGYTVSRSSVALANDGKTISNKADLKPGDILIFLAYNDYSRIGHVGIYIGNNEFIHANDEKTGVIITSLDYGKYPERFVSGRRIID